jgi:signal recognition particle GTPase
MIMDYNKKLESLENEFEKTMNHAVEVMDEYITTSIEKELVEAIAIEAVDELINELSNRPKPTLQTKPEGVSLEELVKFLNDVEEEELRRIFLEEFETLKRNLR